MKFRRDNWARFFLVMHKFQICVNSQKDIAGKRVRNVTRKKLSRVSASVDMFLSLVCSSTNAILIFNIYVMSHLLALPDSYIVILNLHLTSFFRIETL